MLNRVNSGAARRKHQLQCTPCYSQLTNTLSSAVSRLQYARDNTADAYPRLLLPSRHSRLRCSAGSRGRERRIFSAVSVKNPTVCYYHFTNTFTRSGPKCKTPAHKLYIRFFAKAQPKNVSELDTWPHFTANIPWFILSSVSLWEDSEWQKSSLGIICIMW